MQIDVNPSVLSIRYVLSYFSLTMLMSCSGPDPVDSRIITDKSGLRVDLEWNTGGSIAQSKIDVDLDLELKKGTTIVDESFSYGAFEQVSLSDLYADAEYQLNIVVAEAKKGSTYKVFVNGIATGDSKEYEGTTQTTDEGSTIEVLKIVKAGTKYTIQQ